MKLSQQGNELIKSFEGLRLKAYQCAAGKWTIGWGHTGEAVRKGTVWTRQQADVAFDLDTDRFESCVSSHVGFAAQYQHMFDALVSLAFNIGEQAFEDSTLLALLRAGKHRDAAEQFTRWNKAKGKFNPGLLTRRTREMRIFLCGH